MEYFIKLNLVQQLESDSTLRRELAFAMKIGEQAIYKMVQKYLQNPTPNSSLTKLAAVEFFESKGFKKEEFITHDKPAV